MLCMSNITAQHTTSSLESNFNFFYIADLIFMIDDYYTLFYKLKSRYGHSRCLIIFCRDIQAYLKPLKIKGRFGCSGHTKIKFFPTPVFPQLIKLCAFISQGWPNPS